MVTQPIALWKTPVSWPYSPAISCRRVSVAGDRYSIAHWCTKSERSSLDYPGTRTKLRTPFQEELLLRAPVAEWCSGFDRKFDFAREGAIDLRHRHQPDQKTKHSNRYIKEEAVAIVATVLLKLQHEKFKFCWLTPK